MILCIGYCTSAYFARKDRLMYASTLLKIAHMQTLISKILAQLMASAGVTQAQLSRATKVGQPTISRILKPDGPKGIKEPTDKQVRPIAEFFGISSDQLRGHLPLPDRDRAKGETSPSEPSNVGAGPEIKGRLPLISWVQAGDWCEAIDNFAPGDAEDWLPCPFDHSDTAFCLRVVGLSMSPDYREGEVIAVDPSVSAAHGSDVVCRTPEGSVTFKRLQITPDGTYLLAINPDWPNRMIAIPSETHVCGVVIGSWMKR